MARPTLTGYTFPATGVRRKAQLDPNAVVQAITAAAAILWNAGRVVVTGPAASTYAITLAAPTEDRFGDILSVKMAATTDTNAVTLALTNVIGGSAATTASFNAAAEELVLMAVNGKWVVLAEVGVTLS